MSESGDVRFTRVSNVFVRVRFNIPSGPGLTNHYFWSARRSGSERDGNGLTLVVGTSRPILVTQSHHLDHRFKGKHPAIPRERIVKLFQILCGERDGSCLWGRLWSWYCWFLSMSSVHCRAPFLFRDGWTPSVDLIIRRYESIRGKKN